MLALRDLATASFDLVVREPVLMPTDVSVTRAGGTLVSAGSGSSLFVIRPGHFCLP